MSSQFPTDNFLAKWLDGQLTTEEANAWEEREHLDELSKIVNTVSQFEVPATRTTAEAWEAFRDRLHREDGVSKSVARIRPLAPATSRLVRIAATVLALVTVAALVFRFVIPGSDTLATYTNAAHSEPLAVAMPDASTATLGDDSELRYDRASWAQGERKLQLKGEAFFDVAHGSRFDVETDLGIVTVYGTSFNVLARDEFFEVICYTGSVGVQVGETPALTLAPGDRVRWQTGQAATVDRIALDEQPAWLDGRYTYSAMALAQVFAEVERQYDVEIIWEAEDQMLYTGFFRTDDTLDETLENICKPMGLAYDVMPSGRVHITPAF
ncbi:MAG: FecR domain-containing protein [Bacteroidia bacterium]